MTRFVFPDTDLLLRYDRPVPRYTSYPTVPYWTAGIDTEQWLALLKAKNGAGMALYVHLPFCETLCTYCGCNKKITRQHSVEAPYIDAVLREWSIYRSRLSEKPLIRELHLGGGTPTFFSPDHLRQLVEGLLAETRVAEDAVFSVEGHPNNTTPAHLVTLAELGFSRISYGVQDLDPAVQLAINRVQPFGKVADAVQQARAAGFTSVNVDLVFGLPFQRAEGLRDTINQVLSLSPDRIALYSYAHVPWKSRSQRLYDENDLPSPDKKLALQELGRAMFRDKGYHDIGMDHFALPGDALYAAQQENRLHRNFMGYTESKCDVLIGLGVSAISDSGDALVQNEKELQHYLAAVDEGRLPVFRGHFLNEEDQVFRQYILDIACRGKTAFRKPYFETVQAWCFPVLQSLEKDGLVQLTRQGEVTVTPTGRFFLRNVCAAFDLYLQRHRGADAIHQFSKSI